MLRALLLWFYCLPIPQALLVICLATACFLALERRYGSDVRWNMAVWGCLAIWSGVIIMMTVWGRTADTVQTPPMLLPLHSYREVLYGGTPEILRSNFMNVMLFYPVGLMLNSLLPQRWRPWQRWGLIAALCAAASICIETSQYFYGLGTTEMDDVIHNTIGALLGTAVCKIPESIQKR